MNKFHILGVSVLAAIGLASCSPDDSPVLQQANGFELNTPAFATQTYQLTSAGVSNITCVAPDYGVSLAPEYTLQISLLENFGAEMDEPAEGAAPYYETVALTNPHSTNLEYTQKDMAVAICHLRGIFDAKDYTDTTAMKVYMRLKAAVNNQAPTLTYSNVVVLEKVLGYNAIVKKTLYTPGNSNGWNFNNCQQIAEVEEGVYKGFAYLKEGFKFTNANNWSNSWGEKAGKLDASGGNIPVETEGLYYIVANINEEGKDAMTYKLTLITAVGIIGDATVGGWGADTAMSSTDYLTWTVTTTLADGSFKFRFNNDWAINLGGSLDDLTEGGANIPAAAGTKTITLKLGALPYSATVVAE